MNKKVRAKIEKRIAEFMKEEKIVGCLFVVITKDDGISAHRAIDPTEDPNGNIARTLNVIGKHAMEWIKNIAEANDE